MKSLGFKFHANLSGAGMVARLVVKAIEGAEKFVKIGFQLDYSFDDVNWVINNPSIRKNPSYDCHECCKKIVSGNWVQAKKITYTMTFFLQVNNPELPKTQMMPGGKKLHEKLYLNDEFSDVKIFCQDKIFNCHKLILACQSEVFKRMLMDSNMAESISGEVKVTDTSEITMESLLYYIYHDELDDEKINEELLIAAEKYEVLGLVWICLNHLKKNLNVHNAVNILIASYLVDHKELFNLATQFIVKHKGELVENGTWEEMKEKNPKLALKMLDAAMFKL